MLPMLPQAATTCIVNLDALPLSRTTLSSYTMVDASPGLLGDDRGH